MATVYSPFISELREKMEFEGAFLVKIIQLHMDKNGRPYLNLILMDKTGEVEARAWDNAAQLAEQLRTQDIIRVAGKVNLLHADMVALFNTLEDKYLRALAVQTLEDPECKKRILRAPAAKSVHHAYAGGLIEHSLSVCRILDMLAGHYKNYYGPAVSRDLMLIGGLFHDIGKIYELNFERGTEYSKEGQLIGHHVLGCELVDRITARIEGFPADTKIHVKHLILAHHGKLEYGSPKVPHSIEALLVHYVDDLDSKVNTILDFIGEDTNQGEFTAVNRMFEHPFLKTKTKPEFQGTSPGVEA
jgi:3'-5' exoribonuclease